jgi:hypothetical protein
VSEVWPWRLRLGDSLANLLGSMLIMIVVNDLTNRRRSQPSLDAVSTARSRAWNLADKKRAIAAWAAVHHLPVDPGPADFHRDIFRLDSIAPTDADFVFQPPEGAKQVELKSPAPPPAKAKGAARWISWYWLVLWVPW